MRNFERWMEGYVEEDAIPADTRYTYEDMRAAYEAGMAAAHAGVKVALDKRIAEAASERSI